MHASVRLLVVLAGAGYYQLAAARDLITVAGDGQKKLGGDGGNAVDVATGKSPFTEGYKSHVEERLAEWHVPGIAIGVVDGDDIWTEGYGLATLPSTPVTAKTLFYCASTSKAYTAAALAIMISSGNYTVPSSLPSPSAPLSWDTPIASLIPDDFVLADAWATAHITLEDALSHRTGLPRHDKASTHLVRPPYGETTGAARAATVRDGTRFLRHLPLNAAPRTKWQYCNQMFVVASHVIQTLTGQWLGDVLRERIWEPLGMAGTYFSLGDALAAPEHLASGYGWDAEAGAYVEVPLMPTDEIGGAGAVMSNVDDYTKWIRMMLREDGPLPSDGHRAVKTPRMIVDPESMLDEGSPYDFPLAYALGWETSSYRGQKFWTHSGGMHAYGAEVFFFPGLDFGFVAFGNTAGTSNGLELELVWEMVDDKLGVPKNERHDWGAGQRNYGDKIKARIDEAIDVYYPDRPTKPSPPALPLEAYAGSYFHPGYLSFSLQLTSDVDPALVTRGNISLVALRTDATWPTVNLFQHVTGEYWMKFESYLGSGNTMGPMQDYAPVQFEVGPDGRVSRMGITWVQVMTSGKDVVEGLVWFDKIA